MLNLMQAHKQWATRPQDERFTTLQALHNACSQSRERSRVLKGPLGRIEVTATDDLHAPRIVAGGRELIPSNWAFGQFAQWAGAPSAYLRKLPPTLAADCLRVGFRKDKDRELRVLYADEAGDDTTPLLMARAATSATYGRIWNADVTQGLLQVTDRDGRWHNPLAYDPHTGAPVPSGLYASDRDMFAFLIDGGSQLEAGPRAKVNRGFFVENSEVGAATLTLTAFLFNSVCGNHIIWGASDVQTISIRHTSGGPARFLSEMQPALRDYVQSSAGAEEAAIRKAQQTAIPYEDAAKRLEWFRGRGFTTAEARGAVEAAEKEEGQCATLWDAVQGLTAYARDLEWMDARVDVERRAGKLLKAVA